MKLTLKVVFEASLLVLAVLASGCQSVQAGSSQDEATVAANAKAGKALFEEKCRTVAGEKIYRTVPDVEGILLMKVRPQAGEREWADPMWPGAAFALEARTDEYITTFLGYEHSSSASGKPFTSAYRGYISPVYDPTNANNAPGYRYVDVIDEKDGKQYRVTGSFKSVTHTSSIMMGGDGKSTFVTKDFVLDRRPTSSALPRYGMTYEDHVLPQERAIGVASSTVKVVDLQTGEVLGEMLRYAWQPRGLKYTNWLSASKCPGHPVGAEAATRKFADQVLIPRLEK